MKKETKNVTSAEEGVIDYTDQLKFEPSVGTVRNKYCVLSGNVVTVAFAVVWNVPSSGNLPYATIAQLPDDLVSPGTFIPFAGYVELDGPEKKRHVISCALGFNGREITAEKVSSASGGNNYFALSLTFVKK